MRLFGLPALVLLVAAVSGTLAHAADMAVKAPPVPPAPVFTWSGFYLGLNAGGDSGRFTQSQTFSAPGCHGPACPALIQFLSGLHPTESVGLTGGVEAGFNLQLNNLLLGVEADYESFVLRQSFAFGPNTVAPPDPSAASGIGSISTSWLLTVRPRIGVTFDRSLFYLTGGFAETNARFSESITVTGNLFRNAITGQYFASASARSGRVIGGGIERVAWGNWTTKIEYLHVDFGSQHATGAVFGAPAGGGLTGSSLSVSSHLSADIVRIGLNYKL